MRARWGTMRGQRGVLALIVVIVLLLIPAGVLAGDHGPAPASPVLLNVGMPDQPKVRNLLCPLPRPNPFTTPTLHGLSIPPFRTTTPQGTASRRRPNALSPT